MNSTYAGKPVFTKHVELKDLDAEREDADGWVVKSFFNQADGHTWTQFIGVTDKVNEAIRSGWKVSNAYKPKAWEGGGQWHDVDYARELSDGEFTHLAVIPDPRYQESIVLTPEQFKAYNAQKFTETQALTNSKGEKPMSILKFFKKTQFEAPADLDSAVVMLKNGKEMTIAQLINNAEEMIATEDKEPMNSEKKNDMDAGNPAAAKKEELISVGSEQMTLSDLIAKYCAMVGEKANAAEAEAKKKEEDEAKEKQNSSDKAKADAAAKPDEDLKQKTFEQLKNAHEKDDEAKGKIELSSDKIQRGKERY